MTLTLTVKATPKFPAKTTFGNVCRLAEQRPANGFNLKKELKIVEKEAKKIL